MLWLVAYEPKYSFTEILNTIKTNIVTENVNQEICKSILIYEPSYPHIGILAYGSLINDPGPELQPNIVGRIDTTTPFNIEFMRQSASRGNAPTLIQVEVRGRAVRASILVLANNIIFQQARNFLYRRERHTADQTIVYVEPQAPTANSILIRELTNFTGVETVLYTQIGQNIPNPVTAEVLGRLSIYSVSTPEGQSGNDEISYLLNQRTTGSLQN